MLYKITLILLFSTTLYAQESVIKWADYTSYFTAATAPAISTIDILKNSNNKKCDFLRLGLSEAIGNSSALIIKHFVNSPRPCIGCKADGMPSEHTVNSFIGFNWRVDLVFGVSTGILRHEANRHTWKQVIAGATIGVGSDLAGKLVKCGG